MKSLLKSSKHNKLGIFLLLSILLSLLIGFANSNLVSAKSNEDSSSGLGNTFLSGTPSPELEKDEPGPKADLVIPSGIDIVPESYIVVFKPGVNTALSVASDQAKIKGLGGVVNFVYSNALSGYSAQLPPAALDEVRSNPQVAYVEADSYVHTQDEGIESNDVQNSPTWGLDRIDQRNLPLSNSYTYNVSASNVHVYVIDTGILATHNEFGGRATNDKNYAGGSGVDCDGHGTHVAGTIAGATYGIAKGATIHAIKVLNCNGSGTTAGVIKGIDWVTANHIKPAVANMSLGGGPSTALDTAVRNSINAGITYAIASGNDNANACNDSPGRVPNALTVGSTTSSDARSSFSNKGTCLDIFAPGSNIKSANIGSNSATATWSGTSMASPHVAGVVALYLADNPGANPSQVANALLASATHNKVSNPGSGSPNELLYSIFGNVTPTVPGPFGKNLPADDANDQSLSPSISWSNSSGADSYEYCYDTLINNSCDSTWLDNSLNTSKKLPALTPSTKYEWQLRAKNTLGTTYADRASGNFWTFTTGDGSNNDDFDSASSINNLPFTISQSTADASKAGDDPSLQCISSKGYKSVWYQYSASFDGKLKIDTNGSNYDTVLAVWTGSRGNLTSRGCNDDGGSGNKSLLEISVTSGKTYFIEIAGYYSNSSGTLVLNASGGATTVPPAPTAKKPSGKISDRTPRYVWTKVTGATEYQFQLKKGNSTIYTKPAGAGSCGRSNCSSTPSTTLNYSSYTWRVRAKIGGTWGPWSSFKSFTVTAPVPRPKRPSGDITDRTPKFVWTKVSGATSYSFQLKKGTKTIYTKAISSTSCGNRNCSNTPTKTLSLTNYRWRVRAKVDGVWGSWSSFKSFTVK